MRKTNKTDCDAYKAQPTFADAVDTLIVVSVGKTIIANVAIRLSKDTKNSGEANNARPKRTKAVIKATIVTASTQKLHKPGSCTSKHRASMFQSEYCIVQCSDRSHQRTCQSRRMSQRSTEKIEKKRESMSESQ